MDLEDQVMTEERFRSTDGHIIDAIMNSVYDNNFKEKDHSLYVSVLCRRMGKYLKFTEKDILSLEKAAYFHDIGKILFYNKQLSDSFDLSLQGHYDLKKHPVIGYRILDSF